MGWWKQLQRDHPLKNPLKLSDEVLEMLAEDMDRYRQSSPDLPERLLRYVVDGEDDLVLQDLSKTKPLDYRQTKDRSKLVIKQQIFSPKLYRRLIEVYASEPTPYSFNITGRSDLLEGIALFLFCHVRIGRGRAEGFQAQLFQDILTGEGYPLETFVKFVFNLDPKPWNTSGIIKQCTYLIGMDELCLKYPDEINDVLKTSSSILKINAIEIIETLKLPTAPFLDALISQVGASAKTVREAVAKPLKREQKQAVPKLKELVKLGKTEERYRSIQLLWDLEGETIRDFLIDHQKQEKAEKVKALIKQLVTIFSDHGQQKDQLSLHPLRSKATIPTEIDFTCPIESSLREPLHRFLESYQQAYNTRTHELIRNIQDWRQGQAQTSPYPDRRTYHQFIGSDLPYQLLMDLLPFQGPNIPCSENELRDQVSHLVRETMAVIPLEALISLLERGTIEQCVQSNVSVGYVHENQMHPLLSSVIEHPDLKPVQMIRFLCCTTRMRSCGLWLWDPSIQHYYLTHPNQGGIINLQQVILALGADTYYLDLDKREPVDLELSFYNQYYNLDDLKWSKEDLQDFFSEKKLIDGLKIVYRRTRVLQLLQSFSHIPQPVISMLWSTAFLNNEKEREIARSCLNELPETSQKLIQILGEKSSGNQALAAEWLALRQENSAIVPLKLAISKCKKTSDREIMIQALETLGSNIDEYYQSDILMEDVRKDLRKGIPDQLDWFPFSALPPVHWSQTGERVDPDILTWFLVVTYRQKTAEPTVTLRRYISQFDLRDRETLGQFVLLSWIETSPTKCKGVLAICSACCGAAAVPVIQAYLKTWYGMKASQCKVLLQVLSWMEDPLGIQFLLSVANRFRTRSIQQEAGVLVDQLAQRKGWTQEELGDRTIPTGGFDHEGVLVLDYRPRQFQVQLDSQMAIQIKSDQGKLIKSLPSPRKGEDPEQVKDAKQKLAEARKVLKQGLLLQRDRLYESMCTQRSWVFQDWEQFLYRHPLMGRYCQRLVWSVIQQEQITQTFRPLADGSLTDSQDEEVSLDPKATIRIAHGCVVSTEIAEAWRTHFPDYEIEPLFEQFPQELFHRSGDLNRRGVEDFMGYLVETYTLRNTLTKRGYTRGPALDAGMFYSYDKSFKGLNLSASIEFTGNWLPDENRIVALEKISFHKLDSHTYGIPHKSVPLSELPPVLLQEIWNDARIAAAQGTGYDPEWKHKVGY